MLKTKKYKNKNGYKEHCISAYGNAGDDRVDACDNSYLLFDAFLIIVEFVEFIVKDLEVVARLLVGAPDPLRLDLQFSDRFT